jgi:hypothetical protein
MIVVPVEGIPVGGKNRARRSRAQHVDRMHQLDRKTLLDIDEIAIDLAELPFRVC